MLIPRNEEFHINADFELLVRPQGPNDEAIPVKDKSGVYTIGWRIVKADRAKLSVDY